MQSTPMFIDGIGNISMSDSVIRFDLVGLEQGSGDKPTPVKIGAMAMTLPGFLRTVDQMNQVINKLVEQGILKRNEPVATPAIETKA
jgi:hypothetical protein